MSFNILKEALVAAGYKETLTDKGDKPNVENNSKSLKSKARPSPDAKKPKSKKNHSKNKSKTKNKKKVQAFKVSRSVISNSLMKNPVQMETDPENFFSKYPEVEKYFLKNPQQLECAPKAYKTLFKKAPSQNTISVTWVNEFKPNPLFDSDSAPNKSAIALDCTGAGAKESICSNNSQTREIDLLIGLDFGTSSTKIVIRDESLGKSFAVPFFEDLSIENPYLLPSHIYISQNGYRLKEGEACIRDLKMPLIENSFSLDNKNDAFIHSCAYLALAIRHSRGWLFNTYKARYSNLKCSWRLNLGLPARHYEDHELVVNFKKLAWVAYQVASDPSINSIRKSSIEDYILKSQHINFSEKNDYIDVVPEICAELHGHVTSEHWNNEENQMIVVDIGAGTLDVACVRFFSEGSIKTWSIMGAEVKNFGVMNLHRKRVDWLKFLLEKTENSTEEASQYLDSIKTPTDRLRGIPDKVYDYLGGIEITVPNEYNIDHVFYEKKISPQVHRSAAMALKKGTQRDYLKRMPIYLCGGGSRMSFYSNIVNFMNEMPSFLAVESRTLPRPKDLDAPGLKNQHYDRLAVAYGLSKHMEGEIPLGEFIRSIEIPEIKSLKPSNSYEDNYIGAEQT